MPNPPAHDCTDSGVIHLLPALAAAPDRPPAALALPRRLGRAGRTGFALANIALSLGAAAAVFALWTQPTPGLWFDLLFTVMIAGLALAPWAILAGSIRQANVERDLQAAWRAIAARAQAVDGRVLERDWTLGEDGAVTGFALVVRTADGFVLRGQWQPADAAGALLQTQVPGVGAQVRVWRGADEAAAAPCAIEVADPSVVA